MQALQGTIEVVRGRLGDDRGEQILRFWSDNGALDETAGARRLPQVVCVLVGEADEILGVNSVYESVVPLVGGRTFWVYRSFLVSESADAWLQMAGAAFDALHDEFNPGPTDENGLRAYPPDPARRPIGLCVPLSDQAAMERHPEAAWEHPPLVFAGYDDNGSQIRVGYFHWVSVSDDIQVHWVPQGLDDGYEIALLDHDDEEMKRRIIELWSSEGVVSREEGGRRIGEALMVAKDEEGAPVGVCTAYLGRNEQLDMTLWHFRTFVAEAHRMSHIATELAGRADEHLEQRFLSGEDTRGSGFITETENEFLKRYFSGGQWIRPASTYVGSNSIGAQVRVSYFEGVKAPPPLPARGLGSGA